MADENKQNVNNGADILSQLLGTVNVGQSRQEKILQDIYKLLEHNVRGVSAGNARAGMYKSSFGDRDKDNDKDNKSNFHFRDLYQQTKLGKKSPKIPKIPGLDKEQTSFLDAIEEGFLKGLGLGDVKDRVKGELEKIAKDMGVAVKDLPKFLGDEFGKNLAGKFTKNSDGFGGKLRKDLTKFKDRLFSEFDTEYYKGRAKWYSAHKKPMPLNNDDVIVTDIKQSLWSANSKATKSIDESDKNQPKSDMSATAAEALLYKNDSLNISAREITISAQSVTVSRAANSSDLVDDLSDLQNITDATDVTPVSESASYPNIPELPDMLDVSDLLPSDIFNFADISATDPSILNNMSGFADAGGTAVETGFVDTAATASTTAELAGTAIEGGVAATPAAGAGAAGVAAGLGALIPPILIAVAAVGALVAAVNLTESILKDTFAPAIEGTEAAFKKAKEAANRYATSQKKNQEYAQKRLEDDVKTMIQRPFQIMEDAANK